MILSFASHLRDLTTITKKNISRAPLKIRTAGTSIIVSKFRCLKRLIRDLNFCEKKAAATIFAM